MATVITNECINCGACEPECPNTAIYQGGAEWDLDGVKQPALAADIFFIVAEKCTECVGFHDKEACAVVCPVDCCVPDPDRPESESALLERAKKLHPERIFAQDFPSRFRQPGVTAAANEPKPAAVATPAPTAADPIAAKAVTEPAPPPMTPVGATKPAATATPVPTAPVESKAAVPRAPEPSAPAPAVAATAASKPPPHPAAKQMPRPPKEAHRHSWTGRRGAGSQARSAGSTCHRGRREAEGGPPGFPRHGRVGDPRRLLSLPALVHRTLQALPQRRGSSLPVLQGLVRGHNHDAWSGAPAATGVSPAVSPRTRSGRQAPQQERAELESRQRQAVERFDVALKALRAEQKAPGVPHQRAGIFG